MQIHNAYQRGGRRFKWAEKIFMFKFFLSCLKIASLFHCFLMKASHGSFTCHGNCLLGALPLHHTCLWVKIPGFLPAQEWGAAEGVLPRPSPTALLAGSLWAWWHQDAGLWGFAFERKRGRGLSVPSQSPVPVNKLLLASVQWNPQAHIQVHTETHKNTHRACTQAHTLKERHPGAFLAPLRVRAQEAGTGVGLTSCVPG